MRLLTLGLRQGKCWARENASTSSFGRFLVNHMHCSKFKSTVVTMRPIILLCFLLPVYLTVRDTWLYSICKPKRCVSYIRNIEMFPCFFEGQKICINSPPRSENQMKVHFQQTKYYVAVLSASHKPCLKLLTTTHYRTHAFPVFTQSFISNLASRKSY